ncbi:uncharacterized protein LOC124337171 [Daphnia pulicaria]|uniref:uncharacterized protein LOC124337171 n=1 Tax=Daphnia pulicaria TaxID=35523 RepID=UPI001EECE432|nr:uncharacterized protein LOC124337171 [Daphnia pulicaria]
MSRVIISQARRFTLEAKNQFRPHAKVNTIKLGSSELIRHYSSSIDSQLHDEGFAKLKKKSPKMITFKDKIEKHDLDAKLNNIKKWLSKGHFVKASISNVSKDEKKVEQMYNDLMKELAKEGKFKMFKTSSRETKFSIEPIENIETDEQKNIT